MAGDEQHAVRSARVSLHWRILAGLVAGATAGSVARRLLPAGAGGAVNPALAWITYYVAEPAGQIFLRLIFMIVIPLLFCALVLGVASSGNVRRLGRMGLLTVCLTALLSTASVGLGVFLADVLRPGAHLGPAQRQALRDRYAAQAAQVASQASQARPLRDTLLDIIPRNPLREMVDAMDGSSGGGILAVMFFALAFGVALLYAGDRAGPVIAVLEGVYEATMHIVGFAMKLAPVGVAGLMFALTSTLGPGIFETLAWFVGTVLAGLAIHMFVGYSVVVAVGARVRPWVFFARISEAMLTAFATSSSNATLPTSIRVARERLGLRADVTHFVLTVGATANQNGTALYEGVTVLFLAQVFGVHLTVAQQVVVAVSCILAGIGTAGVPGGSIPFVALVLRSVNVPADGIGIIIGVDRLLDMCRTTLNVTGDIAIAACVDRWERSWGGPETIGPVPGIREEC